MMRRELFRKQFDLFALPASLQSNARQLHRRAMKRESLLAWVAATLLRLLFCTIRLRISGLSPEELARLPTGAIICFWHNRILGISLAFLRHYPAGRRGVNVLTSPSRDGEILAGIMHRLGMGSVRGSSSRRGARALRELVRLLEDRADVAITPDGPRGPRYVLGPGVIHLAETTGAPIYPVHAAFSNAVRMKTWDGFIIPLPFSRISVTVDPALCIAAGLSQSEFEAARLKLEILLKNAAD